MFAGDCKAKMFFLPLEDCTGVQDTDGIADLLFSHQQKQKQDALMELSELMLEIEDAGEYSFVQAAIADKHLALLKAGNCTLYNSAIYVITSGQMPESLAEMESSDKKEKLKQLGSGEYICLHTMHRGPLKPQGPNAVVLCILAQLSLENVGHWKHLGMSVMHILNQHNTSGNFKIHSLRIKNELGIVPTLWHCFLNGMCSKAERVSINRILAPRAMLV
jgi:hypothetical protein